MALIPAAGADDTPLLVGLLREHVRRELKADLMKVAEERVDAAVNQAIAALEMHIRKEFEERSGRVLVDVLVKRRDA